MNYEYTITYSGPDYMKWDKVFRTQLRRTMKKAGRRLATVGNKSLAYHLKRKHGLYSQNSPLYKKSKGGKSVFYNVGFLRNAPTYELTPHSSGNTYATLDVGFPDDVQHPSGTSLHTILKPLISGRTWTPSPAQRRAYWAKVKPSMGKSQQKQVTGRAGQWTQPKRDFISKYAEMTDVNSVMEKYIGEAIDDTYKRARITKKLS